METKKLNQLKIFIYNACKITLEVKKITAFSLYAIVILISSCTKNDELTFNVVYGISLPNTLYNSETDSIVRIDLSNGTYKNLFSTEKFEGLKSTIYKAYSKNQNAIIYDIERHKIGFINLTTLTSESIDLRSDSTFMGIKSLLIIEEKDLLLVFNGHFNYSDNSRSLEITCIDLKTKNVINKSKLMDFEYFSQNIFTEIDELNNRIFIVPDNSSKISNKLYIYNYENKSLKEQLITANFLDVHYTDVNQRIVGSSYTKDGIGLISYSINEQKTDTIGNYTEIYGIMPVMNYFDTKKNLYWLGVLSTDLSDKLKLQNIDLSNASFTRSFSFHKGINFIK